MWGRLKRPACEDSLSVLAPCPLQLFGMISPAAAEGVREKLKTFYHGPGVTWCDLGVTHCTDCFKGPPAQC